MKNGDVIFIIRRLNISAQKYPISIPCFIIDLKSEEDSPSKPLPSSVSDLSVEYFPVFLPPCPSGRLTPGWPENRRDRIWDLFSHGEYLNISKFVFLYLCNINHNAGYRASFAPIERPEGIPGEDEYER